MNSLAVNGIVEILPILTGMKKSPYFITGPALISFSGGRTSGFMLRQILDAHGGDLPFDFHVCFFNTGKEFPQTLDFVHEVETRWRVNVIWLEFRNDFLPHLPTDVSIHKYTARVNYETASRKGEPFNALTSRKKYLPNQRQRFCTQELKIRQGINWMKFCGVEWWTQVIGFRADEPHRLAKRSVAKRDVDLFGDSPDESTRRS